MRLIRPILTMSIWTYSASALAADGIANPLLQKLVVAIFPLVVLGLVMWLVIKLAYRNTNSINVRIVESNERIAQSLEKIATLLDDNTTK